ncbi:hypothetical protein [Parasedimentitalea psychrophila]|uniref:Uncharacterized protein n=1 Tax=Parasedimentitalea psychrophila TaxID=2997337 RepID=A0A9Y2L0I1_9RHOB|nr:hypothetical protein [Parasedimentitalea psychrophila]WIY24589.1 hypothetical protein QPJ95_19010 [Parasedimentitalea psychrophila]
MELWLLQSAALTSIGSGFGHNCRGIGIWPLYPYLDPGGAGLLQAKKQYQCPAEEVGLNLDFKFAKSVCWWIFSGISGNNLAATFWPGPLRTTYFQ